MIGDSQSESSNNGIIGRIRLMLGGREASPVARQAGIPASTMHSIMHGTIPRADNAVRLASALGCSVEWLITGEDPKPQGGPRPITVGERPRLVYGDELSQPSDATIAAQGNRYRRALATLEGAIEQSGVTPADGLRQVLLSLLFRHEISVEDLAQLLYAASPASQG